MTPARVNELEKIARGLRATCIRMSHEGREGHLGGSLSCVDILVALYYHWLKVDPATQDAVDRDRLLFSKGHACSAIYAVLASAGFIERDTLNSYNKPGSPLPLHPCKHSLPALEFSSGSLGHGLGVGAGIAYGHRLNGTQARTVVLLSDGECNEGSVWEAAMLARAQRLDGLVAIVDYNGTQSVGMTDELMGHTSIADKFRAFGWAVKEVDGNNIAALADAFDALPYAEGLPSAIVATTRKGVSFMEDQILWHYRVPSKEEVDAALAELGEPAIY